MAQMTFLDFFSGIGGFRKGFELCGMRCVGHCEIDKYADRSYRAIHNIKEDEWYAADITKVTPAELPRADLWAAGFPCQDISVSGRQRGINGARSGLFFTLAELVKGQSPENRPTWIVLENVKNLLSIHGGWDFAAVLDTLASLGYHIEYGLLNTKDFGPPQNRERVYLVACRHPGAGGGPKVFPVPAGRGKALVQLIGGMQGQRVYDPSGISVTMAAQSGGWGGKTGLYFVDLCNGNPKLTSHARCIKTKYNSGITNRGGDNSGVFYGCRAVVTPEREEKSRMGGGSRSAENRPSRLQHRTATAFSFRTVKMPLRYAHPGGHKTGLRGCPLRGQRQSGVSGQPDKAWACRKGLHRHSGNLLQSGDAVCGMRPDSKADAP